VVARVAERHDARLRAGKELAWTAEARIGERRVALARPQTYMNESGMAVVKLVRRFGVADDLSRVLIVHDELDLPLGRIQVKVGGGLAGNNGLRSIQQHLKSADFLRIRIGIGKPAGRKMGADHVLSRPSKRERDELDVVIEEAADAVELVATEGVTVAQNRYNPPPDKRGPAVDVE